MGAWKQENLYDVVVIGGGPAGLTAALYLARARYRVVVVEKEHFGGQITITSEVVNYPGVFHTSGTELTETMRRQAQSFGAEFLLAEVSGLELDGDVKTVRTSRGELHCFGVLLATGAHPRSVGFTGEEEFKGHGVAYCATCDGVFYRNKVAAVIGGGDVAIEDAIFLGRMCKKVYLIHRRDSLRGAKSLQNRLFAQENIEVIWDTVAEAIEGEDEVTGLRLKNRTTGENRRLQTDAVFVAVGIQPNSSTFDGLVDMDEQGYILADENGITSRPGIFAAGDVRTKQLRQIVTAVSDGANCIASAERWMIQE